MEYFSRYTNFLEQSCKNSDYWRLSTGHPVCCLGVDQKIIIFDGTAEAKALLLIFHAGDADTALQADRGFGVAVTAGRNHDNAFQPVSGPERLLREAIEPVAGYIFGGAFDRSHLLTAKQTHRPVQCDAFAFAAIRGRIYQLISLKNC